MPAIRTVNRCLNHHGVTISWLWDRAQIHAKDPMKIYYCTCLHSNRIFVVISNKQHWNFFYFRADYIAWNGANSDLRKGSRGLAKLSDTTLRSSRLIQAQGSKSELCKGPNPSLAKGSIYSQLKMQPIANVKCN